jgi:flagellar M-ring protein FliF
MTAIRHMVASGAGVKPEYVTVVDLGINGYVSPGTGKENGVSEFENIYTATQRIHVDHYTRLLRERLSVYPGIQIAVHVELDKDVQNQTQSFKYDEKPTSYESTTLTKESSSKGPDSGGRPGAVANGAAANSPAQVASAHETTMNESKEQQKSVVGTTQTTTQKVPLIPVAVSASIGIPTSYFAKIWQMRNPPASGEAAKTPPADQLKRIEEEKIKEIEEAVIGLLPPPPKGDDRYKPVKVVSYDETPLAEIEPPNSTAKALDWLAENWQTLGLFALAAFGVVFLRGMIRSANQAVPVTQVADAKDSRTNIAEDPGHTEPAAIKEPAAAANVLKKRFQGSGRGLREELAELVREDPDAAANVLKLWISNAA